MMRTSVRPALRGVRPILLLLAVALWMTVALPAAGRTAGERNVALEPASQLAHPAVDPRPSGSSDPAREVGLLVLVGTDGKPKLIRVERSSGLAACDRAALQAAIQWRFVPALRHGEPIDAYARIPVHFYAIGGMPQSAAPTARPALPGEAEYLVQSGYLPDGTAIPFVSVSQAEAAFASWPHSTDPGIPLAHAIVARDPEDAHVSYVILGAGSPFHPAIVRRHLVFDSGHLEMRSAILCQASAEACVALRKALDRIDIYCGDVAPGCPGYNEARSGNTVPDALYRFLPRGFTPVTREPADSPVSGLVAELSRSLTVSFACGTLESSPSLLTATRKRAIRLSLPFTNGDASEASVMVDRLIGRIREAGEDRALGQTFADGGLSPEERIRSCDWLVLDAKARLDRAEVSVTDHLRRESAAR